MLQSESREAFLRAIREAPADDAPRLVYSDWLDETGLPEDAWHAELIRLQCRPTTLAPDAGGVATGGDQEERLLGRVERHLGRALLKGGATRIRIHRGFPESFRIDELDLLRHAGLIARLTPVTDLHLDCGGPLFAEALGHEAVTGLQSLTAWAAKIAPPGIEVLASAMNLPSLRSLQLVCCDLGDGDISALSAGRALAGLRRLGLPSNRVGSEGTRALAHAFRNLDSPIRVLDLSGNHIDCRGAEVLAACPGLAGLEELNLSNNPIGDSGALALAASPHLGRLRSLGIAGCDLRAGGIRAIVESPRLGALVRCEHGSNHVSERDAERLAASWRRRESQSGQSRC